MQSAISTKLHFVLIGSLTTNLRFFESVNFTESTKIDTVYPQILMKPQHIHCNTDRKNSSTVK